MNERKHLVLAEVEYLIAATKGQQELRPGPFFCFC